MRDRRPVDELSIEELERILVIRKREQRMQRMERMRQSGRVMELPASGVSEIVDDAAEASVHRRAAAVPLPDKPVRSQPKMADAADTSPRFEDDVFAEPRFDDPAAAAQRRTLFNRVLLGVEVVAVFGLLFIGVNMALSVNALQRETQAAQEAANQSLISSLPTMAPTSILSVRVEDYVLPGGHVIDPDDPSIVRINQDEILEAVPTHLQVAVLQQALPRFDIVRPPPTLETALRVSINRLGIDQPIVQGSDWEALRAGIGQVLNGAFPGADTGNVVLSAHNDIYGELFRYLDTMQIGDEIYVQTASETHLYRVSGTDIAEPDAVHVMRDQGRPTLTLISCYPYQVNNLRYIVYAERIDFPGA